MLRPQAAFIQGLKSRVSFSAAELDDSDWLSLTAEELDDSDVHGYTLRC